MLSDKKLIVYQSCVKRIFVPKPIIRQVNEISRFQSIVVPTALKNKMYNPFIVPYHILDIVWQFQLALLYGSEKAAQDFSQPEIFAFPGTSK